MSGPYTLDELRRFIRMHDKLNDSDLTKDDAIRWWSLGWIEQIDLSPPLFRVTDRGQAHVDSPP